MRLQPIEDGFSVLVPEQRDVRRLLPVRDRYAHKGDFGKVLLLCGAVGYTGAAALAARAALRSGAGLVTVLTSKEAYPIVATKLDEAMVRPVACDAAGRVSLAAEGEILEQMARADCALLGPGLGRSAELDALIASLIRAARCPVVLDADGLNAVAGHIDILREAGVPVILTPHDGEFARLLPDEPPLPAADIAARCRAAARLAKESGCIVLLKGHRTVITDGEKYYVNFTGNPGMATGGSGDVLSGIIVSLLGQGVPPLQAAALGACLHGAAFEFLPWDRVGQHIDECAVALEFQSCLGHTNRLLHPFEHNLGIGAIA